MKDKTEVIIVRESLGMINSALIHELTKKHSVVRFYKDDYLICRLFSFFKL